MKQWISGILFLMCGILAFAQTTEEDFKALSPEDQELLSKTVKLVDDGLSDAVMPDFDYLVKKYPDNYLVRYERAYNLYMLGRYADVIKEGKFLLKQKSANERTFQLIGNAYDLNGNRKMAAKTYREGIKKFPESGSLYLELGTVSLLDGDYNKALEYYNQGILVQPDFASNYFRAANLYFASENGKVWGLVYAETAILLAPSDEKRHEQMAGLIAACLKENIKLSYGDKPTVSVNLVSARDMKVDEKMKNVYLDFPGIYEGAIGQPLMKMFKEKVPFTGSLSQLIELRKGLVETYFAVTDNLYGNSMYLLEFQKKIIDAGHWEAYNYFLFMLNFPEEFSEWYSADSAPFDAFIEWYNKDPYRLGDGKSVDPMQIFKNYTPVGLAKSLRIQSQLLIDAKLVKSQD
ncbi:MAG: hypothetical protein K2O00_06695 [Muribaculaceae bacterium]|nr:hypothetical protein [Muribaculaceae bacterium]